MFGVYNFPQPVIMCFLFARIHFIVTQASPLVSTLAVMRYVASGGDRHFSEAFSLHSLLFLVGAACPATYVYTISFFEWSTAPFFFHDLMKSILWRFIHVTWASYCIHFDEVNRLLLIMSYNIPHNVILGMLRLALGFLTQCYRCATSV